MRLVCTVVWSLRVGWYITTFPLDKGDKLGHFHLTVCMLTGEILALFLNHYLLWWCVLASFCHCHNFLLQGHSAALRNQQAKLCTSSNHRGFELVAEVLPTIAKLPTTQSSCVEGELARCKGVWYLLMSWGVSSCRALSCYSSRGFTNLEGGSSVLDRTDSVRSLWTELLLLLAEWKWPGD